MSDSKSIRAIVPAYVTRFSCIGAACEDTCCSGWRVHVDRATFHKYRSLPDGPLRDRLSGALTFQGRARGRLQMWGTLEVDDATGACRLLEDGLCSVQRALGEDALSDTCAMYPRRVQDKVGTTTLALVLSCPEAARLALLAEDAFEVVEQDVTVRDADMEKESPSILEGQLGPDEMRAVRFLCIRLMNTATVPLWMRLAMIGRFCDDLTKIALDKRTSAFSSHIAEFEERIESGHFNAVLRYVLADHVRQVSVAVHVLESQGSPPKTEHQRRHWHIIRDAFGVPSDGTSNGQRAIPDDVMERYRRGLERLKEVLAQAPMLLDHVARNIVFTECFPFGAKTPWQHFCQIACRVGLVRFLLAARCTGDVRPSVPELVQTVQAYARRYEHTPKFAETIDAALASTNTGTMSQMDSFLRDALSPDRRAVA